MKTLLTLSNIAIIIVLLPLHVQGSTYSTSFWNSYTTDAIYLFVYDDSAARKVIFQDVSLRNPSGWTVLDHTDTYIRLGGTDAADRGSVRFNITFSDGPGTDRITDFRLEWAEFLDGLSIDSGTLSRIGNSWRASDDFNSTVPTPIPGSTWLLLSGIFFLVGVRRHSGK